MLTSRSVVILDHTTSLDMTTLPLIGYILPVKESTCETVTED